jgi:hypothetical protein
MVAGRGGGRASENNGQRPSKPDPNRILISRSELLQTGGRGSAMTVTLTDMMTWELKMKNARL